MTINTNKLAIARGGGNGSRRRRFADPVRAAYYASYRSRRFARRFG